MKKIWVKVLWVALIALTIGEFALLGIAIVTEINSPTPVERNDIEELLVTRDSLINEIDKLDSIKNEKITEIYNLDNDSTIKLFYKLVSNR